MNKLSIYGGGGGGLVSIFVGNRVNLFIHFFINE